MRRLIALQIHFFLTLSRSRDGESEEPVYLTEEEPYPSAGKNVTGRYVALLRHNSPRRALELQVQGMSEFYRFES